METQGHARCVTEGAAHPGWSFERLYVVSIPLAAGIASVSGLNIGGLHYTGFLWMAYLCLGSLLVIRNPEAVRFPIRWWAPFLALAIASTFWGGFADSRQSQAILQWTATMVVGMVASMTVRNENDLRIIFRGFSCALALIVATFLYFHYGPGSGWHNVEMHRGFSDRTAAITLALIAAVAIARFRSNPRRGVLVLGTCLVVEILTGSRTATAAILLAAFASPLWRERLTKIAFLLGIAALLVLVVHTAAFQERFFFGGQGTIGDLFEGNIDSSGRYALWPALWAESLEKPILGHGIGTAGVYLAVQGFLLGHPHNEYLRVVFELGFVGLVFFLGAFACIGIDAWRRALACKGEARHAFAAVCTGIFVLLIMCTTDNPLPYNLAFMHPLFLLIGAAYGAAGSLPDKERGGSVSSHASQSGFLYARRTE